MKQPAFIWTLDSDSNIMDSTSQHRVSWWAVRKLVRTYLWKAGLTAQCGPLYCQLSAERRAGSVRCGLTYTTTKRLIRDWEKFGGGGRGGTDTYVLPITQRDWPPKRRNVRMANICVVNVSTVVGQSHKDSVWKKKKKPLGNNSRCSERASLAFLDTQSSELSPAGSVSAWAIYSLLERWGSPGPYWDKRFITEGMNYTEDWESPQQSFRFSQHPHSIPVTQEAAAIDWRGGGWVSAIISHGGWRPRQADCGTWRARSPRGYDSSSFNLYWLAYQPATGDVTLVLLLRKKSDLCPFVLKPGSGRERRMRNERNGRHLSEVRDRNNAIIEVIKGTQRLV